MNISRPHGVGRIKCRSMLLYLVAAVAVGCLPGVYGNGAKCVDANSCTRYFNSAMFLYQHCGNCHMFVYCIHGMYFPMVCPSRLYWNDITNTCDYKSPHCHDDECTLGTHKCHQLATCFWYRTDTPYRCICKPGYEGNGITDCNDVDECQDGSHDCDASTVCTNTDGSFTCTCPNGFTLENKICKDIDECKDGSHNCPGSSVCTNTDGSFTCMCKPGFTLEGQACRDIDECKDRSNDCDPNAVCSNTDGSFICTCQIGFTTEGNVCKDIDECTDGSHNCGANAVCNNTGGSFTCTCQPGFTLIGQACKDIDECADGNHDCDPNAVCSNTEGSFTCKCLAGYNMDGNVCKDINECTDGSHNCGASAVCNNTDGSFTCTCQPGFSMIGQACKDIDECTAGIHNCDSNAMCSNTDGSFSCTCNIGYIMEGNACKDVDECTEGSHGCDTTAVCTNTDGSFTCTCHIGFKMEGNVCKDIDECDAVTDSLSCDVNALCTNTDGSFTCTCDAGFIMAGTVCNDKDECKDGSHNCGVNSICSNTGGSFTCTCQTGYSMDINECIELPKTCQQVKEANPMSRDGLFDIYPPLMKGERLKVYCYEMDTTPVEFLDFPNMNDGNYPDVENPTCGATDKKINSLQIGSTMYAKIRINIQKLTIVQDTTFAVGPLTPAQYGEAADCYTPHRNGVQAHCGPKGQFGIDLTGTNVNIHPQQQWETFGQDSFKNISIDSGGQKVNISCGGYCGGCRPVGDLRLAPLTNINECIGNMHNCDVNAVCTNNDGSFTCTCQAGFSMDANICKDINECIDGSHSCDVNAVCTNTDGSFTCACKSGFIMAGSVCKEYPRTCQHIKNAHVSFLDGLYDVYPELLGGETLKVYCHNMATTPVEFLAFSAPNHGMYPDLQNPSCSGADQKFTNPNVGTTSYQKIKINIQKLTIVQDSTFAEVNGKVILYGTAADCYTSHRSGVRASCGPKGSFYMDFTGTNVKIDPQQKWETFGQDSFKEVVRSANDQIIELKCGGFCGGCKPVGDLQLVLHKVPPTCQALKDLDPSLTDGVYFIYPKLLSGEKLKVYCHNMATTPVEFVQLEVANEGIYPNSRDLTCSGTVQSLDSPNVGRTDYNRIRINPERLTIMQDTTFAKVVGGVVKYGTAADCHTPHLQLKQSSCGPKGSFAIDFTGTSLKIDPKQKWETFGKDPFQEVVRSANDQIIKLKCGGFCGGCRPVGDLQLVVHKDVPIP
ncbi:fibrillin-3-like isoform X2 [Gigantopelta aegis]|uniref:fibrillin-3-like isoform X2 n=1 Tax=Gigantopelta aegis TaxID=1735272 RepID=UPI001B88A0F9|nr:fibrillin-3-like isoform X2 [Gigantopelta aegis]